MQFKLTIDKTKEEKVEATLNDKGEFSYRLEELVLGYSGDWRTKNKSKGSRRHSRAR